MARSIKSLWNYLKSANSLKKQLQVLKKPNNSFRKLKSLTTKNFKS